MTLLSLNASIIGRPETLFTLNKLPLSVSVMLNSNPAVPLILNTLEPAGCVLIMSTVPSGRTAEPIAILEPLS
jgi:hypothetical protein